RAALHDASARVGMFASRIPSSQLSRNDSSPPSEKKPFYIIPVPISAYASKADAVASISAIGRHVSASAETHEYSATFDAEDAWGKAVYCRLAVSNVYESATGGTCAWHDRSASRSVAIVDDVTYTWQAVDGDWNGDWTNAAHWASSRPGNCVGVPSEASTAFFPTGSTVRVTMPDGLTGVGKFDISAPNLSLELFNASNAATLKPYDGFVISTDTTGAAKNQSFVFCHQRLDAASPADYAVANASAVREIMETSGKVIGVFAGHQHADVRSNANGICHYTLPSLALQGAFYEVGCYPFGVSLFRRSFQP
ncbi:MAG: hypothetical protein IKL96_12170, partial [Kiritimatiellae bacterium]|nr:hypothetical protein [Kiritimatiellia bacterium]